MGTETAIYLALAATAASTAVSAYGTYQQGQAENRRMEFNAKVEENNAISAGYAALQETQAAAREAEALREDRVRVLASQRSAVAASGLMISGSAVDVMGDTALASEKEIAMAYYKGQMGAYNQTQQASNFRSQATLSRMSGQNAKRSGLYGAVGTTLSGAASIGTSYAGFKKK